MKKTLIFGCASIMLLSALTGCGMANSKVVEDASKNVSSMTENGAVSDNNGVIGDETVDVEETTETVPDTSTAPTASDMNE